MIQERTAPTLAEPAAPRTTPAASAAPVAAVVDAKLERTLTGHAGPVTQVKFLASGQLVSSSGDGVVKLWDLKKGKATFSLKEKAYVSSIDELPGGYVATGSYDETIKIWSLKTGKLAGVLGPHIASGGVLAFKVTRNGNVVSCTADNSIKVWNPFLNIGNEPRLGIYRHGSQPRSVLIDLLPDDYIISCSSSVNSNCVLRVWDPVLGSLCKTYSTTYSNARSFKVLANCEAALGFNDGTILLVNLENGRQRKLFDYDGTNAVTCFAEAPKGHLLSTATSTVKVWNLATDQVVKMIHTNHSGPITSLSVSKDGSRLATGSEDKTVKIWSLTNF